MSAQPALPAPRRETHAEHAASMRGRILDGASRAFASSGFRGTSVPEIAGEAGVSVGLIYRYFPSKEELFLAVCARETEQTLDELAARLAAIADPRERLRAVVGEFVDSLHGGWGSIMIHAWAEADRNPRVRDLLLRTFVQQRGFAAMFAREAVARGEAPADLDIEAVSLAAAMLLHGAIAHQAEAAAQFDFDLVARSITTVLGASLREAVQAPNA